MTALALPSPRLIRADLLKLRRRRSLSVVVGLLTAGAITLTFTIIQLVHLANPAKHGVAGGLENLGNATSVLAALGAAAAAIVASAAATGDLDAGVYRDLVVTGRSRVALLLSRLVSGLLFLLPFVAAAYAIACVASVAFRGSLDTASVHLMVATGLWALLGVTFYYVLAFAVACLTGSRSYTIGFVLAWRLALTPLLSGIAALGVVRELIPGVAIANVAPAAFAKTLTEGAIVPMSMAAVAAVLIGWVVVALAVGGRRDIRRDA